MGMSCKHLFDPARCLFCKDERIAELEAWLKDSVPFERLDRECYERDQQIEHYKAFVEAFDELDEFLSLTTKYSKVREKRAALDD